MKNEVPVDMGRVAAIILGGGQGSRLSPLTITRCKPAISFGGKYRLVDIPMSNAINSGCSKIFILTQFLSSSLNHHIVDTYRLGTFSSGFIDLLPAEQKPTRHSWFQGPADAVRQNIEYIAEKPVDYFLILSGDQLYNMDFRKIVAFAQKTDADLVVAALPVNESDAKRMGILKIDEKHFISDFYEKPQDRTVLETFRLPESMIQQGNLNKGENRPYLGSMGIYLFKREALLTLLQQDPREDFGKHLIPTKVKEGNVAAYLYDGYWEDIGTIDSFYKANMALTKHNPEFNCYDEKNPIFTSHVNLAGPRFFNSQVDRSIVCEGSTIEGSTISDSILGPRSVVKKGTIITNTYCMGNDYYHHPMNSSNMPPYCIGEECVIDRAIIDKHVHIGRGVKLINEAGLDYYDSEKVCIRDGIIVVMRGVHLPDGFIL